MKEILAVFRSRSQAIDAAEKLKNAGIAASIVNTPREANVGCGLSVKFFETSLYRVRTIIARGRYSSFSGYPYAYTYNGKKFYKRL